MLTAISRGAQLPATLTMEALTPSSGLHAHPHLGVHTSTQAHTYMLKDSDCIAFPVGKHGCLVGRSLTDWGDFGFLTEFVTCRVPATAESLF